MLLYLALLVIAAAQDVVSLRISNLLSVSVLVVAAAALVLAAPERWWEHVAAFALVLLVGIFLFTRKWMGGGDVKLFAAAALAFNFEGMLRFLPAALIAGGLIALVLILSRTVLPAREGPPKRREIPYGVAIAAGAVGATLLYSPGSVFGA